MYIIGDPAHIPAAATIELISSPWRDIDLILKSRRKYKDNITLWLEHQDVIAIENQQYVNPTYQFVSKIISHDKGPERFIDIDLGYRTVDVCLSNSHLAQTSLSKPEFEKRIRFWLVQIFKTNLKRFSSSTIDTNYDNHPGQEEVDPDLVSYEDL